MVETGQVKHRIRRLLAVASYHYNNIIQPAIDIGGT